MLDQLDSNETYRPALLLHRQRLRHSHKQSVDVGKDTDRPRGPSGYMIVNV